MQPLAPHLTLSAPSQDRAFAKAQPSPSSLLSHRANQPGIPNSAAFCRLFGDPRSLLPPLRTPPFPAI